MQEEIWKDVPGYKGIYQVSDLGNIKSLDRYVNGRHLGCKRISKGKNITLKNGKDYYRVYLYNNGVGKNFNIHRLVAMAFIPNIENKETVNHKDGNKLNNKLSNLEWATRSENQKHMYEVLGVKANKPWLNKTGIENKSYKIVYQYNQCGEFLKKYYGCHEAMRLTGFNFSNIAKAARQDMGFHMNYLWSYKRY